MDEVKKINNYQFKLDVEPQNRYEKAMRALLEAEQAFQVLSTWEKERLVQEYMEMRGMHELYKIIKQHCRCYVWIRKLCMVCGTTS